MKPDRQPPKEPTREIQDVVDCSLPADGLGFCRGVTKKRLSGVLQLDEVGVDADL